MIEAGIYRLDITPPLGICMGGHPGIKYSQIVLDPLFCRVLILKRDDEFIAFVSADLLFLDDAAVTRSRKFISNSTGITPERIFLNATHTHSGPLTTDIFGMGAETDYVSVLPALFAKASREALNRIQPVQIGFGKTNVPGISFHARYIMADGTIETHPFKSNPDIVQPEGPVDDELIVMFLYDTNKKALGGIINYALHPQFMSRSSKDISADYPGRIEKHFQKKLSSDVVVLFANGACGDICPVNAQDPTSMEVGEQAMDKTGELLAEKCISLLHGVSCDSDIHFSAQTQHVRIPNRTIDKVKIFEAKEFFDNIESNDVVDPILSDYGTEIGITDKLSIQQYLNTPAWKKQECKDVLMLHNEMLESPCVEVEISIVTINDNAIVMLPFELFTEYGMVIKKKSPFAHTMVVELANGYSGYVPTKKAFSRPGGYETCTLRSSKLIPEAGEIVVNEIEKLLFHLRNVGE